jgi:hypothetical protein
VFGHINTSNSASSWSINSSGAASFPSLTSGVSSISSLAVNSSSVRSSGDLITISVTPTGNYIYLNNGGVLGGYNTTGNPASFPWTIDMVGLGTFRSISSLAGSINNLYSNILSINNGNALRSANDLFNVSVSPTTGNYLYYNNSSAFGHINTSNSAASWLINSAGSGTIPVINSTTGNITTGNITTLNVYETATINKVSINSTMRSNNDLFNVSSSSTGPYLFIGGDCTIGTYNTSNSSFPWFVEMDGDSTFQSVSTPHLKATGRIKQERIEDSALTYNVTNNTTSLTYLTSSGNIIVNLNVLNESNNYNMYEFRCTGANAVRFNANGVTLYDNSNTSRSFFVSTTQKYFKFHYIEQNGSYFYHQFI